ncbi:MAG: macro domain-containing protein [Candidatus Omnitrophica bacterium]|nr:macro domain-containing protein [Candidatus Omnitrophota bacterium]MCF7894263.1 macro domain-containing protein [Candidatus Omnitrophota bacterium]
MSKKISGISIECTKGDIAAQPDLDAVVNAANKDLVIGGGVAGAIHRKAGPKLEEESAKLGPIKPGQAVITGAYQLSNKFVIHCLGPVYGKDKPEDRLLADCYRNALYLAEQNKIKSIGFPAISTGAFGYPIKLAIKVVKEVVEEIVPKLSNLEKIKFVLYNQDNLKIYQQTFKT